MNRVRSIPISEAKRQLSAIVDEFERDPYTVVAATKDDEPVLALMSWDAYEGLLETLEIMSDPELVAAIRSSEADVAAGRFRTTDEVRRELGL